MQLQPPPGGGVEPRCPRELEVGDNPLPFAWHSAWRSPSEKGLTVDLQRDQPVRALEFDSADDGGEHHERVAGVFRTDQGFARDDDPFRPNPQLETHRLMQWQDRVPWLDRERVRDLVAAGVADLKRGLSEHDLARDQVHTRAAHERGDEPMRRTFIDSPRRVDLHDPALVNHGQSLADAQGLALVMSDMHYRRAKPAMELDQLAPERCAERIIEVRERLIQQQDARLTNHRPAQRHALAFASREPGGPSIEQPSHAQHLGNGMHAPAAPARATPGP